MIQPHELPGDGAIYEFADAEDISHLQQEGWRCVLVVPEQVAAIVPVIEKLPDGEPQYLTGNRPYVDENGSTQYAEVPPGCRLRTIREITWRARFLMRKDHDTVVGDLRLTADLATKRAHELKAQLDDAQYEVACASERRAKLEGELRDAQRRRERLEETYDQLADSHRALEDDFGKLREAFGSVAVKKALGDRS